MSYRQSEENSQEIEILDDEGNYISYLTIEESVGLLNEYSTDYKDLLTKVEQLEKEKAKLVELVRDAFINLYSEKHWNGSFTEQQLNEVINKEQG